MRQNVRSTGVVEHNLSVKEVEDYNSFVLKVVLEDSDKVKNPALWPKGVYVSRYYPARK